MKSSILVTVGGGVVQGIWVSKDILDTVQVIVKDYDCQQDEDQPNMMKDENGDICEMQKWDQDDFITLSDIQEGLLEDMR